MSAMLNQSQTYLGQSWIGTNDYDKGQCVGLYNKVVLDVTGLLYPLQGAQGAKDLITCKNTRPDLFQQIKNNPNDPNQLPQIGDWIVWGSTWGGGYGHVACAKTVSKSSFTSIEQNYVPNKVTEQWHDWNGVIGWVRYTPPAPAPVDPCADVKAQLNAANQQISTLNGQLTALTNENNSLKLQLTQKQTELDAAIAQVTTLSNANTALSEQVLSQEATINQLNNEIANKQVEIAQLNSQIEALNAEIEKLKKELEHCGMNITINLNFIGIVLWWLIGKVGKK
jgi:uncharacterized coiled-coil protein SlyX